MTLREFLELHKQYIEEQDTHDRRFGRLCALLANINRDPKKGKEYREEDFFPNLAQGTVKKQRPQGQSAEAMLNTVKILNKLYGGTEG